MIQQHLINKLSLIEAEIDSLSFKERKELPPKVEAISSIFSQYLSPSFREDALRDFINNVASYNLADKISNDEASWNIGKHNLKYRIQTLRAELEKINFGNFFDEALILRLSTRGSSMFDLSKLVRFCQEVNSNYSQGNFLSVLILLRAILNHIPPIFGYNAFNNLVTTYKINKRVGKNEIFDTLQNGMRKFGDFHNHDTIKSVEILPTVNQIEPFKPSFEYLLQEIIQTL